MDPDPERLQFLVHALEATRYSAIASATILFYDHLISLDREISLIWSRSWSFLKGVFIWHRYFGLLCVLLEMTALLSNDVTPRFCSFWFRWETLGFSTAVLSSELVLLLWIFVMYNRNRRIVSFLAVLFVVEVIAVFTIIGESLPAISHVRTDLIPDMPYCGLDPQAPPPPFFFWYWIPILLYNTVILVLFIFKGYQIFFLDRPKKLNSFMLVIYKNSMLNFVGMFASYALCCVFWLAGEFALRQIPVVLALSFSITNATRLLLNIRHGYFSYLDDTDVSPLIDKHQARTVNLASIHNASGQAWMIELRELKWSGP